MECARSILITPKILFTAAAYPDTLVASALRMVVIYIAMVWLSSSVGNWVQRSPNRLRTLLTTIVVNRASVIVGSLFWLVILSQENLVSGRDPTATFFILPRNDPLKHLVFAVAIVLGIIERLSASGNLISMTPENAVERDWIVTVASPPGHPYDLAHMNAAMRRIDLVCKLISPIVISAIFSVFDSMRIGVLLTALTSTVSLPIETVSARRVWDGTPVLRIPKCPPPEPEGGQGESAGVSRRYFRGLHMYFSTSAWAPSLALAMLYVNVMTWRPTFITWLVHMGYSLNAITIARTVGSVFEVGSTVVTPRGVEYMGRGYHRLNSGEGEADEVEVGLIRGGSAAEDTSRDGRTLVGLQRFGLWGFTWHICNIIPVAAAIWTISAAQQDQQQHPMTKGDPSTPPPQLGVGWSLVLFSFLALSRFGVWIFDLTSQQLMQTLVPQHQRSSFAGIEASVINVFQLLGAGAAILFPRMEQFKWLVLASFGVLVASWIMYAAWVRSQRGHLVHWEKLGRGLCR